MRGIGIAASGGLHLTLFGVAWLIFQIALGFSNNRAHAWTATIVLTEFEFLVMAGSFGIYKSSPWVGPRLQSMSWAVLLAIVTASTAFCGACLHFVRLQAWVGAGISGIISILALAWLFSAMHEGSRQPTPKEFQAFSSFAFPASAGSSMTKAVIVMIVFPVLARVFFYLMWLPIALFGLALPASQFVNIVAGIYGLFALGVSLVSAFKICRKAWPKTETARA